MRQRIEPEFAYKVAETVSGAATLSECAAVVTHAALSINVKRLIRSSGLTDAKAALDVPAQSSVQSSR